MLDDVAEGLEIAARQAPAVIGLLEQRQQPLGAERERAEHRDRLDHSARLEAHRQGDEGDRHQPRRLDDEARRSGDELVRRVGAAVAAVELAELGLEQGLGPVEDDVPDPAQPFLDGAGALDHRPGERLRVALEPRPDDQADRDIGEATDTAAMPAARASMLSSSAKTQKAMKAPISPCIAGWRSPNTTPCTFSIAARVWLELRRTCSA